MKSNDTFRFSIDRGGTFTDVYAEVPNGEIRVLKLLSDDPTNYPDGPREGIRRIFSEFYGKKFTDAEIDTQKIEWIRMGTTVATNALLERKGSPFVLVTTKGFKDLLQIGNQSRPQLFDLEIKKPDILYQSVVEIEERVRPLRTGESEQGNIIGSGITGAKYVVLQKPDRESLYQQLESIFMQGNRNLAVVFLHAYAFPAHELIVEAIAKEIGFHHISLSHKVMPMVKMVARGDTTTVDAYLTPHIQHYLHGFSQGFVDKLVHTPLLFMQSNGGLAPASDFRGSNAILSGPAGGVVGYAMTTYHQMNNQPVIGFDMGGTSTDVSRYGGEYELVHETETAGVRIQAPQMQIKTVAAGGGSRLLFRNQMFEVGPESVGADPGPVCYRKGGFLSITDANLFLGRLQPDYFPKIFGETADLPLDLAVVDREFQRLTQEINREYESVTNKKMTPQEVAAGFIRVANEVMVRPIREISVMRGFNIKEHVLACFGGAGGQHACAIARELGIQKIYIHRFAGILSAYGMGLADVVVERQEPCALIYGTASQTVLQQKLSDLGEKAVQDLRCKGYPRERIQVLYYLNLRYQGTDTAIMTAAPEGRDFARVFSDRYKREFGFELADRKIVVDDLRARAIVGSEKRSMVSIRRSSSPPPVDSVVKCFFEQGWTQTPVYRAEALAAGHSISGPAMIMQNTSTIIVEPDCRAEVMDSGDICMDVPGRQTACSEIAADPVMLSIFSNLFMSVAEQMGRTLQKTAISTNIKERLDFSCAVFDGNGGLVSNAPHIPVHLGAMGECVRHQIRIHGDTFQPGDAVVSNHPAQGGSHLPDITVISPVMSAQGTLFYVASRGHHADIGGISPGSMPPFSTSLDEEGACIRSFMLVKKGRFDEQGISELLLAPAKNKQDRDNPQIPGTRRLADNISDLKAQVAANKKGIDLLIDIVDHYSTAIVLAYMNHIQHAAEQSVRNMLQEVSLNRGLREVDCIHSQEFLDDGSPIALALTIDRTKGTAIFDFSGTGREVPGNLNTPEAITRSVILYCLRSLIKNDIPLNQGCLNPITIIIEKGSLLCPSENAAVVGGNVLTSQRIADVIFKALNAVAGSQGCMNNLTFGNELFGYYETIGGGAGAGPSWNGQSGVHTHMTNTRITDPEILECRYPVMLEEFSLRKNSGGQGRFRGGDGLIRKIRFLDSLQVAILSERRVYSPYGLEGGNPGQKGRNLFVKKSGEQIDLGGKNAMQAGAGDCLAIMTPGGGGFGAP